MPQSTHPAPSKASSRSASTLPFTARGLVARALSGGALMGLANLVPGVSGGTMLLAAGIYREFVDSIANLTRLRLRTRGMLVLGLVVGAAALAILLGAGLLRSLVVEQRWIMFALFIGLTLGGVPLVWRPVVNKGRGYWLGAMIALAFMLGLAWTQGNVEQSSQSSFGPLAVAGAAGASAMILPGLSGGYLLLLLGQYVPILTGVDGLKDALVAQNFEALWTLALELVLPVGLGVVLGVVLISNLVQWFFRRFENITYGVLLGLLLGATAGLWPFQRAIEPVVGETVVKGQVVTAESLEQLDPADLPLERFAPTATQSGTALLLVLGGLAITLGVGRLGQAQPSAETTEPRSR